MIDVQNLTKSFGDKTVLDRVSFHVEKGEIFGFLGPNGVIIVAKKELKEIVHSKRIIITGGVLITLTPQFLY